MFELNKLGEKRLEALTEQADSLLTDEKQNIIIVIFICMLYVILVYSNNPFNLVSTFVNSFPLLSSGFYILRQTYPIKPIMCVR